MVPPRPLLGVPPLVAVGGPVTPLIQVPTAMPTALAAPMALKQVMKAPVADEPPAKKAKTEDQLMPEGEFLAKFPEVEFVKNKTFQLALTPGSYVVVFSGSCDVQGAGAEHQ